ncbi:hypothetical protein [Tolypothrix sp. VBCCA 56010]|uniref:hypothetical protein n=1 Tax=Tolypothrix sp. VBCCA 56010 TaxID=3137731 RepID=UPI003D7E49C8
MYKDEKDLDPYLDESRLLYDFGAFSKYRLLSLFSEEKAIASNHNLTNYYLIISESTLSAFWLPLISILII